MSCCVDVSATGKDSLLVAAAICAGGAGPQMGCMLVMIELVEALLTGLGTESLISGMEGERVKEGIC